MKDVATYCRWKFLLEAVVRIPVGLLLLFVAFFAVPQMVADEVAQKHGTWSGLGFAVIPLLIGYLIFSSGVRRVHAAVLDNCWFRAGSEGIAFRLPYKSRPQTLFLTHKIAEVALPWKDVRKIYPLHYKVNGIPFGKSLMVDTVEGRFNFGGYFKESPAVIIATLRDAGSA
ncbi:MAG TPA: hypothetical protein VNW23_07360 [Opitutaceae bacterium]|jgi:hypothetical protein|nr:hypothetical protein [Opitutaceae bacterium]